MENYLSPKTEKIIEVFAIILTCVFMFGVILQCWYQNLWKENRKKRKNTI
jgi:hypothetical protein